jgi:hypothetical protein
VFLQVLQQFEGTLQGGALQGAQVLVMVLAGAPVQPLAQ